MSNVPLLPFTVILAGANDYATAASYYHVQALDAVDASKVAMRCMYDEQHMGWDAESLADDPFEDCEFTVICVFAGYHVNLSNPCGGAI